MNNLIKISIFIVFQLILSSCYTTKTSDKNPEESYIKNKPNIVFILADDMGVGDISGLNNHSKINTPNIDKLINNGMTFTDMHSTASICTPSRYSILTGRYAWRTELKQGVLNGYSKAMVKSGIETLPEILKKKGYTTALIGKWHLGWNWQLKNDTQLKSDKNNPYNYSGDIENEIDFSKPFSGGPVDNGFDYFYGVSASLDFPPYVFCQNNMVTDLPDDYFNGNKLKDNTAFLKKQKMQRNGKKSSVFEIEKVLQTLTEKSIDYINNSSSGKPFFLYFSMTAPHTPVVPAKEFRGKSDAGIYGDFIEEIDMRVGQIVAALKEKGIEDNTIIIFTADNGASRSSFPLALEKKLGHKPSGNLKGRKGTLHEGGHRVPFVIQWKEKINGKTRVNSLASQADLYSTFADLTNQTLNYNQGVDSYSLLPLLNGKKDDYQRKYLVVTNYGGRFSIKKENWKLDLNPKIKKRKLHNLNNDIKEKINLYNKQEYENIKKELMKEISEIILNGRSTKGQKLPNETSNDWKQIYWLNKK